MRYQELCRRTLVELCLGSICPQTSLSNTPQYGFQAGKTGNLLIQDGSGNVNNYDRNITSPILIERLNGDVSITVELNSVGGNVRLRVEYYETLVPPSGGMASNHRKGVTAGRLFNPSLGSVTVGVPEPLFEYVPNRSSEKTAQIPLYSCSTAMLNDAAAKAWIYNWMFLSSSAQLGFKWNIRLTETRGLHLPGEPQEERNRSWAVRGFSASLTSATIPACGGIIRSAITLQLHVLTPKQHICEWWINDVKSLPVIFEPKTFFLNGNGNASLQIFDYPGGIAKSLLELKASDELPRYFQTQKSRVLIRITANIQNGFLFFRINKYAVPPISPLCGGSPNNGSLNAIVSTRNQAYSCFWQMQRLNEGPMWFESKLFQAPEGVAYLTVAALSGSLEKLRLSFAPEDMWSVKKIQTDATEMFVKVMVLKPGLPLLFQANYKEPTYVKDMRSEVIGPNLVLNWTQGDMPYDFLRVSWQKDNKEIHQDVPYNKQSLSIPIERESSESFKISVYPVNSNVARDTWTIYQPEEIEKDPLLIVVPSYTSLSVELTNIYLGSRELCFLWKKDFHEEAKKVCQNNNEPDNVIRNLESGTAYHVTYQVRRQKRLLIGKWVKVKTLSLLGDIKIEERPGEITIRWDITQSTGAQLEFTCSVNVPKGSQLMDCDKELPQALINGGKYVIPVHLTDVEYTIQYRGTGEQGQPIMGHPIIVKTKPFLENFKTVKGKKATQISWSGSRSSFRSLCILWGNRGHLQQNSCFRSDRRIHSLPATPEFIAYVVELSESRFLESPAYPVQEGKRAFTNKHSPIVAPTVSTWPLDSLELCPVV
ncbi:hypothetical protein CSKR_100755 [Clonorchis sinensis]|uniref:Uncharacterized protein n=1 Tax=Clonorchis sinensis TaxID=79923 RepID=A0A3R7EQG8_CLOSI|nr:hypothetical protein CSKR_100755 [Clonorchis sinensis]